MNISDLFGVKPHQYDMPGIPLVTKDDLGRRQKLWAIKRFAGAPLTVEDNNALHVNRLHRMVNCVYEDVIKASGLPFDREYALVLAEVHDDPEMFTGDIPTTWKQRASVQQLQQLRTEELSAIETLAQSIEIPYGYSETVQDAMDKRTIVAQNNSYLDKYDGFCVAFQEVAFFGNAAFIKIIKNYATIISEFPEKYSNLKPFFALDHPFYDLPALIDMGDKIKHYHRSAIAQRKLDKNTDGGRTLEEYFDQCIQLEKQKFEVHADLRFPPYREWAHRCNKDLSPVN